MRWIRSFVHLEDTGLVRSRLTPIDRPDIIVRERETIRERIQEREERERNTLTIESVRQRQQVESVRLERERER